MKVSTKGRYGVRFMLDVALHQDEGPVTLKDVARRQEISEKYLWQVLNPLKAAGLVTATRGAHGGYALSRPASKITIRDIVATLEGECFLVECTKTPDSCDRAESCVAREMWQDLEDKMAGYMRSITLKQLVEKQKTKEHEAVPTYSI